MYYIVARKDDVAYLERLSSIKTMKDYRVYCISVSGNSFFTTADHIRHDCDIKTVIREVNEWLLKVVLEG